MKRLIILLFIFLISCTPIKEAPTQNENTFSEDAAVQKWREEIHQQYPYVTDTPGSPEQILREFSKALQENRVNDALDYFIVHDEETRERYREFFEAIGEEGVKDFGQNLALAKLQLVTIEKDDNPVFPERALFNGTYHLTETRLENGIILPPKDSEIRFYLMKTPFGWKVTEIR